MSAGPYTAEQVENVRRCPGGLTRYEVLRLLATLDQREEEIGRLEIQRDNAHRLREKAEQERDVALAEIRRVKSGHETYRKVRDERLREVLDERDGAREARDSIDATLSQCMSDLDEARAIADDLARQVKDKNAIIEAGYKEKVALEWEVKEARAKAESERKMKQHWRDVAAKNADDADRHRGLLREARDLFREYEMDVDAEAPPSHRDAMARIDAALEGDPDDQPE